MRKLHGTCARIVTCSAAALLLTACATTPTTPANYTGFDAAYTDKTDYKSRLPSHMDTDGKKMVYVDPNTHAWGAYDAQGNLIKAGIATAGARVCPPDSPDEADCRTGRGTYRITSLGDGDCYSKKYPKPTGGGLMPYCMFFNNGQALHGSPDNIVVNDNLSHGCVRMRIPDAEWMRYNFAQVGTKVVVAPYN